jgi:outer membrane protein
MVRPPWLSHGIAVEVPGSPVRGSGVRAMMRASMRLVVIVIVIVIAVCSSLPTAEADLLGRVFRQLGSPPNAPQPVDDLEAWAGPARATSLPELLETTVRQAPALAGARIDIDIAEARIYQTLARDDWQLGGQANVTQRSGGVINGQPLDRLITASVVADALRPFAHGGTLTLRTRSDYFNISYANPDVDRFFGAANWQHEVSATFNQPLLRARGTLLYYADERRAALSRDATVLGRRLAAIQAVQVVVTAYWDLVLAQRQVAITRASLGLARERLRITQIGADGGKIPRSEIPAVEQIIATREEEVLSGELAVLDRSIALRRAAGMPIGQGELGLRVDGGLAIDDRAHDLAELVERAYQASPELAQLAKQDAIARLDIEVAETGLLPQLDAALTIGSIGADGNFGTAWKNLATLDTLLVGGTLTFRHSLGQENVRGQVREQRHVRRRLEVTAFDIRAQIAQAMARAVAQLELARRRVALSQRAIDLANQNIQIESDRFNLGKATNFDVLNRQEELRQAELRQAQAMVEWHRAEAVVQALTGDILPAYGIAVE